MTEKTIKYQELLEIARSMKGEDELFYFFLRACENGNLKICQICLEAGADINIYEHLQKQTLLNKLVTSGKFTTEVGDWLIEKGADINTTELRGWTNLTLACYTGNFDIAKYFIDKGIKIRQYQDNIHTPSDLYYAVAGKNYEIVKMLLELGVELENNLSYVINPFNRAIQEGASDIVELFLQKGVSPNYYVNGRTPLHEATVCEDIETAHILLKYNADVNAKLNENARFIGNDFVLTSMDIAVLNKDIEMQNLLSDFGGAVSTKEEKINAILECCDGEKALIAMKKIMA